MNEIFQRPEVTHFHDTSVPYAEEYGRETPEGFSFRIRREKVLAMLPDGEGKKILDLASGPGTMIKDLRARGYAVTCVDAAPGMIEIAKKVAGDDPMVTCEVGDAYALRFDSGTFDAVTATGLIEYLVDERKFLAEVARVVKTNGIAIITVPNVWSPWRLWNRVLRVGLRLFKNQSNGLLHREYTLRRVKSLLRDHGFKPEGVAYYNVKLVPLPFDRMFPTFTARFTGACEWLSNTPLKFLATGFIVRATKKG